MLPSLKSSVRLDAGMLFSSFSRAMLLRLLMLICISALVLSANAGADNVNIMHAAKAADAARWASFFCLICVPPLRSLRGPGCRAPGIA